MQHGHVRYIGVSNWAAWQIAKALGISERLGLARFASLQAYYTIAGRDLERELVPMMQSEGVGLMVWSPLAGGLLSGKYDRDGQSAAGSRRLAFDFPPVNKDRAFDCVDVMRTIAESKGVSVAQIALAWLLHQKAVTSVIIGAKRVDQLDDNIAATGIQLSDDEPETAGCGQRAAARVSWLDAGAPGRVPSQSVSATITFLSPVALALTGAAFPCNDILTLCHYTKYQWAVLFFRCFSMPALRTHRAVPGKNHSGPMRAFH